MVGITTRDEDKGVSNNDANASRNTPIPSGMGTFVEEQQNVFEDKSSSPNSKGQNRPLRTIGTTVTSGPLLLATSPEVADLENETLLNSGSGQIIDGFDNSWIDQEVERYEEVFLGGPLDYSLLEEPMDTEVSYQGRGTSKGREPSLPPEDFQVEGRQGFSNSPPLRQEFQSQAGVNPPGIEWLEAIGLTADVRAALNKLPDTIKKMDAVAASVESLKESTHKDNQLLQSLKTGMDQVLGRTQEIVNVSRGFSGRLDDRNQALTRESASHATLLQKVESTVKDIKGCVSSLQFYIARKTAELDAKAPEQGVLESSTDSASSRVQLKTMANLSKMADASRAWHKKQDEKQKAKAEAEARNGESKTVSCRICGSIRHGFKKCDTFPDVASKRKFLVENKKCLLCLEVGCDGGSMCAKARNPLCNLCKSRPPKERMHAAFLCLHPERMDPSSVGTESIHGGAQRPILGKDKTSKKIDHKKTTNGENMESSRKRARTSSENDRAPLGEGTSQSSLDGKAGEQDAHKPKKNKYPAKHSNPSQSFGKEADGASKF